LVFCSYCSIEMPHLPKVKQLLKRRSETVAETRLDFSSQTLDFLGTI